jgi:hypothetical protein
MKVEAPRWSAIGFGRSGANCGAAPGDVAVALTGAAAACAAFHFSTSRFTSSFNADRSAISASTCLKSETMSPFSASRSAGVAAASRRASMAA